MDFIFPRRCVSCGSRGNYFCLSCQKEISYFTPQVCPYCHKISPFGLTHKECQKPFGLDGLFVFGHYDGPLKKFIKKVKYQKVWKSIEEIAPVIAKNYHKRFLFDFLVPVPLSSRRESERGFNQALVLAECLQREFADQVVVADILKRTRNTKPQFELSFSERQKNVVNAFLLKEKVIPEKIRDQRFCLIDDVATTGSTLCECAKVLKSQGAAEVFAITIARGS